MSKEYIYVVKKHYTLSIKSQKRFMKVKEIIIYPIKGLNGISLSECRVGKNGLALDRMYMLADHDGNLISQRTTSKLTQMYVSLVDDKVMVSHNRETLLFECSTMGPKQLEAEVWGTRFICHEVSEATNQWFSSQLGMPCKLLVMPNKNSRIKKFQKAPFETTLSFADGYPMLTLSTSSVNHLNEKLEIPIDHNRFRANIIIEANEAHIEDQWKDFKIGETVTLRNIKRCVRCQVININQESGVLGKEPLRTLATYRKLGKGVCFGSNVITLIEGTIKLGDQIQPL